MRTNETIEVKGAIVVTKHALEEINQVMERIGAERNAKINNAIRDSGNASADPISPGKIVSYAGALSDGTQVQFDSFTEVISYPNRSSRRLIRLSATLQTAKSDDFKMVITLDGSSVPCVVMIDGDQRDALHAKELTKDIIERVRAGHGWLYSIDSAIPSYVGGLSLMAAGFLWWNADRESETQEFRARLLDMVTKWAPASDLANLKKYVAEPAHSAAASDFFFHVPYIWALAFGAIFLLMFSAYFLWPRVVFEIGQEIERSEMRKFRRRWVITGLILAPLLALLVRYLGWRMGI